MTAQRPNPSPSRAAKQTPTSSYSVIFFMRGTTSSIVAQNASWGRSLALIIPADTNVDNLRQSPIPSCKVCQPSFCLLLGGLG